MSHSLCCTPKAAQSWPDFTVAMQVEFGLPDLESRAQIFQIHTRTMNCERDIRFELLARLCPNSTGADIRSVCTEAGMFAIRARRKTVTEKDFLESVNKVMTCFSSAVLC